MPPAPFPAVAAANSRAMNVNMRPVKYSGGQVENAIAPAGLEHPKHFFQGDCRARREDVAELAEHDVE